MLDGPWWRAPFQLVRRPGVAVALTAAAFVAVLPAAAAPQFLAAAESATMSTQVTDGCRTNGGVSVLDNMFTPSPDFVRADMATLRSAVDPVPNLGRGIATIATSSQVVAGLPADNPPQQPWRVTLLARDDFAHNVAVLEQASAPIANGVWVPDDIANAWQVQPGDKVTVSTHTLSPR